MIIGLVGVAGSGKDATADFIKAYVQQVFRLAKLKKLITDPAKYEYGRGLVYSDAFAFSLKQVTAVLEGRAGIWGSDPREFKKLYYLSEGKEQNVPDFHRTRRQLLQDVGVGLRELLGPNVWITPVLRKYLTAMNAWRDGQAIGTDTPAFIDIPPLCIVSDVRFDNEIEAIRNVGGQVYYISRPDNPVFSRMSAAERAHPSVPSENKWHLPEIENSHDLPWLQRRSQEIARQILMDSVAKDSLASRRLDRILF